jgi:hypothetical protein
MKYNFTFLAGSLLFPHNNDYYIVGLLSIAQKACLPNIPAIFTNISNFLPWITENVGMDNSVYEKGLFI